MTHVQFYYQKHTTSMLIYNYIFIFKYIYTDV